MRVGNIGRKITRLSVARPRHVAARPAAGRNQIADVQLERWAALREAIEASTRKHLARW